MFIAAKDINITSVQRVGESHIPELIQAAIPLWGLPRWRQW